MILSEHEAPDNSQKGKTKEKIMKVKFTWELWDTVGYNLLMNHSCLLYTSDAADE